MILPQFKLAFDVGHGSPRLIELPRVLMTHGHLDHSAGLPYYISQRSLRRLPAADIYCPPPMVEPFHRIMAAWAEIEDFKAEYNLHALDYERLYPLQGSFHFRAVPSVHRVPSNGYVILEKTKKLKDEFKSLSGPEIAKLKNERDDMFYEAELPLITFSGDTQIEFILENELVRRSRVLFLECTYISDDRPVERARRWGHIHLDEIAANADAFAQVERLFLIHFSPRYRADEVHAALKKKLPPDLLERTTPFLPVERKRKHDPVP